MATDLADYSQGVQVLGGSVSITGIATVTISGTPNVSISGTPNVNVANTPSVTISSGTVSISGTANINIAAQGVNLNTQQPQTSLGNFTVPNAGTNNVTYSVPAGTHAVGILVDNVNGGLQTLQVQGVTSGITYILLQAPAFVGVGGQLIGFFISPVLSVLDTQVKITGICSASGVPVGPTKVYAVAILDAEGVFVYNNTGEPTAFYITDRGGNVLGTNAFTGGAQDPANSLPVVVASAKQTGYSASSVGPANNTPTTLLAANIARKGVTIYNNGVGGSGMFIYGNTAVTAGSGGNAFVRIPVGGYYELPRVPTIYTDIIKCQSIDATSNSLLVVEWT